MVISEVNSWNGCGGAEVDSFVQNLKNLWKSDFSAHTGQAWVGLHVRLGHPLDQVQQSRKSRNGPPRQLRRARRLVARK